ncbi:YitT family protein [Aequorivita echinoideorum]|uniref:YitT family protein n=1 Tax=Aequorivita echinoideorum TaxID=1549647 RepID=A0ABS5S2Q7_9FLAO|nr:YitT family protein [Aequorivita echinoideorum]MBT0607492.1 YitT family protein [Aequorivita echinoideorum]
MNHFFKRLLLRYLKRRPSGSIGAGYTKRVNNLEVEVTHEFYDFIYLLLGITSAAFGLKGFLMPSAFIDGGVMGISLMVNELFGIPLSILIVCFNLPFLALAYISIGKRFAIKSIIGIVLLALAIVVLPFPEITDDKILIAAFGGLFLGLGIGLAIRGGSIIDGTEVLAIFISRKTSLTVGNVILIFNVIIFLNAAYFLSTEVALYAILTYFSASKTVDFVIDGIEEFMGITIISEKNEEIRLAIVEKLGRGCTMFVAENGFSKRGEVLRSTKVVYTVITRLEMSKLKTEIDKVDKNAFIIMASVKDAKGGMIKKKPIKKIK